jgi:hypothetical protein
VGEHSPFRCLLEAGVRRDQKARVLRVSGRRTQRQTRRSTLRGTISRLHRSAPKPMVSVRHIAATVTFRGWFDRPHQPSALVCVDIRPHPLPRGTCHVFASLKRWRAETSRRYGRAVTGAGFSPYRSQVGSRSIGAQCPVQIG